jgi:hypothetical protein
MFMYMHCVLVAGSISGNLYYQCLVRKLDFLVTSRSVSITQVKQPGWVSATHYILMATVTKCKMEVSRDPCLILFSVLPLFTILYRIVDQ